MNKLIIIALVVVAGWYGNYHFGQKFHTQSANASSEYNQPNANTVLASNEQFKCDGRVYCSQMTSCAEATYFINHCPNTKMDGNNDGIPCEKQWCK